MVKIMESSKMLEVVEVSEERLDKNGMVYRNFKFRTPNMVRAIDEDTGERIVVKKKSRTSSCNLFKHNYLELSQLKDSLGVEEYKKIPKDALTTIEADWGYDLQKGDKVQGKIVQRTVEPYQITNADRSSNVTNIYSAIVFGNTNDPGFEAAVIQTFARANKIILDNNTPVRTINRSVVEQNEEVFEED